MNIYAIKYWYVVNEDHRFMKSELFDNETDFKDKLHKLFADYRAVNIRAFSGFIPEIKN